MKNEHVYEYLIDYLEDQLDADEMFAVEAHLTGCESCSGELDNLRHTFALLNQDRLVEPDSVAWANFLPNVRQRLDMETKAWWQILWPRFIPAVVAACTVVLMFITPIFVPFSSNNADNWLYTFDDYHNDPYSDLSALVNDDADMVSTELLALVDQDEVIDYLDQDDALELWPTESDDLIMEDVELPELIEETGRVTELFDEMDTNTRKQFFDELNKFNLNLS